MTCLIGLFVGVLAPGMADPAPGPVVEVKLLDGGQREGAVLSLSENSLRLQEARPGAEPLTIAADNLLSVSFKGRSTASSDAAARVALRGGGLLVAKQATSDDHSLSVVLTTGAPLSIPLGSVAALLLGKHTDEMASRWLRQAAEPRTSDRIVAQRGNEQAELEGVLGPLTSERLTFTLDGEDIAVKRDRLVALYYATEEVKDAAILVQDVHGNTWPADRLSLSNESLGITSAAVTTAMPISEVVQLDFARRRVVYLSDLEPAVVEHTPFFDTAWPLKKDANFTNGPLRIGEQTFARGLLLHSKTSVTYDLGGDYRRLSAHAGIEAAAGPHGDAQVQIQVDGRTAWESRIRAGQAAAPLDLDVTRARRLVLVVDFGKVGDFGDHVVFGDIRLIK